MQTQRENTKNILQKPVANIKLKLIANKAVPSTVLGQALGQYGIDIMQVCKIFNNQTCNLQESTFLQIPLKITIYNQKKFDIKIKTPSTSEIVKNTLGIKKASKLPKKVYVTSGIRLKEIYHIGLYKKSNQLMNHLRIKSICKTIIGTIKSLGIPIHVQAKRDLGA